MFPQVSFFPMGFLGWLVGYLGGFVCFFVCLLGYFKKSGIFLKIFTQNGKCCMHLIPSSKSSSSNLERFLPQSLMENIPRGAQIYNS